MHTDTASAFELLPPKRPGISVYTANTRLGTHLTLCFLIPAWTHSSSTSANWHSVMHPPLLLLHTLQFSTFERKRLFFCYSQLLMTFNRGRSHMHTRNYKHVLGTSKGLAPLCYQKQAARKDLRQPTLVAGQLRWILFLKSQPGSQRKLQITPGMNQSCSTPLHILNMSLLTTRNVSDCCNSERCASTIYKYTSWCSTALSA